MSPRILGSLGLLVALATPGSPAAAADANAFIHLQAAQQAVSPDAALRVTSFGTTTLLFQRSDGRAVLIDGFFSRPGGLLRLALGHIGPDRKKIRQAINDGGVPTPLDAVLVSHTHHDHALDAAHVACDTGAELVGSPSLQRLQTAQLRQRPDCVARFRPVESRMSLGPFEVEALSAEHVPGLLMEGRIEDTLQMPAHVSEFKLDGVQSFLITTAGRRVLVSAGLPVNRGRLRGAGVDVVFLSIGGFREGQEARLREHWDATVRRSGAALVIPMHWDDFTQPLVQGALPVMPPLFGDYQAAMCELLALARRDRVAVRLLPALVAFDIDRLGEAAPADANAACGPAR